MKTIQRKLSLILFVAVATLCVNTSISQSLASKVDALLTEQFPADGPGATALIAKNGKVIYRNAFGQASLELSVPMKPDNVFEIGSMTKQFTAVGILMLEEQGKLSIEDEITKFIPDYPTLGKKITVHHLLTHTSGIKSYTDMGNLQDVARTDMEPMEIIDFFKNEPMDFDPGTDYRYNNSGYILLGYIIEKVSGMYYADFVQEKMFDPLGMTASYYGSKTALIPNRAVGYMPTESGFRNADYLSMTLPYAAGSLMSTVDDLLKWQNAITHDKLISSESKKKAFTGYKTLDGKPIYYGYGWGVNEIADVPSVEHGGGIFGYLTSGVYVPEEDIYVVVLTNSNASSPTELSVRMAAMALGKPYGEKGAGVSLSDAELNKWIGTYEFEDGAVRYITMDDGALNSQREGGGGGKLIPVSKTEFEFEDSFSAYKFAVENGKKVAYFKSRIRSSKGHFSDKKPPAQAEAITVAPEVLAEYVGKYELQPGFEVEITTAEDKIFAQATGQPQVEIFGETENIFFLKVVQAKIEFHRGEDGKVSGLTLHQGGQQMEGKKLH